MPFYDPMYNGVRESVRRQTYQHDETDDDMIWLKANEITKQINQLEAQLKALQNTCPHTKDADVHGVRSCRNCFKKLTG